MFRQFGADLSNNQINNSAGKMSRENFSPNLVSDFSTKMSFGQVQQPPSDFKFNQNFNGENLTQPKVFEKPQTNFVVPEGMELSYLPMKNDMSDNLRMEQPQLQKSVSTLTTQASLQRAPRGLKTQNQIVRAPHQNFDPEPPSLLGPLS